MSATTQIGSALGTAFLAGALAACGTTAVTSSHPRLASAGDANAAKVYFLRPDVGYFGLDGLAASILLDNKGLLSLAKGEYALVYLKPPGGTVTVETLTVRSEFGKNVGRKVRESDHFDIVAGKTYYVALCKSWRHPRGATSAESYVFPAPIAGRYAIEGASALNPSGDASREPLAMREPREPDEALRVLKDACVAAYSRDWYAQQIERDCADVHSKLLARRQEAGAGAFCETVKAACASRSQDDKCTELIKNYDGKRFGSGPSLLMEFAGTRIPRRGRSLPETGDTAAMRFLLDMGFDPNARVGGETSDAVMELVVPGYVQRTTGDSWRDFTPLMVATTVGDRPMVRLLLRAGAKPNTQNDQGRTALMYAAGVMTLLGERFAEIATDLLDAGADLEVRSWGDTGTNALMFAAYNGRADIVKLLLERGANPAHADEKGRTALDFAESKGHAEVIRLLKAHGKPR